jgi:CreA protein
LGARFAPENTMRLGSALTAALTTVTLLACAAPALAADPDLIFKESTTFKWVTPNDKIATYAIDDPEVEGVACYFAAAERGGVAGMFGVAEETSDVSLACRQVGPIQFKNKIGQGSEMFNQRRSIWFKKMRISRGCDAKRNVLVYLVYSDKLVDGSPKNSISSVPIMPWGDTPAAKCGDFIQ